MISDYIKFIQDWCRLKILLWNKTSKAVFKRGDIWWCSLGINLGEEMYGKGSKFTRPVLIFRKFTSNSFLALPITKQEKQGTWYVEITIHGEKRWIMLNQARVFDKKRLTNRIGVLDDNDFQKVKKGLLNFIAVPKNRHPVLANGDQWENPKLYYHYTKPYLIVNPPNFNDFKRKMREIISIYAAHQKMLR